MPLKNVFNSFEQMDILFQLFVSAFVCRPSIDLNNHIPHADMTHQNRILPALCRLHKQRPPQAYITQLCFFFHGLSETQTNMQTESLFLPLCDGPTHMSQTMSGHLPQHAPFCGLQIWLWICLIKSTPLC